jgi:hypothetical protein
VTRALVDRLLLRNSHNASYMRAHACYDRQLLRGTGVSMSPSTHAHAPQQSIREHKQRGMPQDLREALHVEGTSSSKHVRQSLQVLVKHTSKASKLSSSKHVRQSLQVLVKHTSKASKLSESKHVRQSLQV